MANFYRVHVHIIQALNLMPKSDSNTAIPVCTVEVHGQTQSTPKDPDKTKTLSPFWDKEFVFELKGADLRQEKVKISIFDSDTWLKTLLLGEYVMELAEVYQQPGHEYYRQWAILTDPKSGDELSPTGWLKCSVLCLQPEKDPLPSHEDEDPFADAATDNAETLDKAMLSPPKMSLTGLVVAVDVWKAENLPTDMWGRCDPYIAVRFGGTGKRQTSAIPNDTNPTWNENLAVAVRWPALADNINIELYDKETLGSDPLISSEGFSAKYITECLDSRQLGPLWVNMYGHPKVSDLNDVMHKCFKKEIDEPPRTEYKGRVLLTIKTEIIPNIMEAKDKAPLQSRASQGQPVIPSSSTYQLWFYLFQGSNLPENSLLSTVSVEVQWGPYRIRSKGMRKNERTGTPTWCEVLPLLEGQFPEEVAQVPDVTVNLMTGFFEKRIAFKKFKYSEEAARDLNLVRAVSSAGPISCLSSLEAEDPTFAAKWHMLEPDVFNGDGDQIRPYYLQFQIGASKLEEITNTRETLIQQPQEQEFVILAHVYQARFLRPANPEGTCNAVVEVRLGTASGKTKFEIRKPVERGAKGVPEIDLKLTMRRQRTCSPIWYETVVLKEAYLPPEDKDLRLAAQLSVLLWDVDPDSGEMDKLIGFIDLEVKEEFFVSAFADYQPRQPKWRKVKHYYNGILADAGEILISFDIMHPKLYRALKDQQKEKFFETVAEVGPDEKAVYIPGALEPEYVPDKWLQISILGLRDLIPRKTKRHLFDDPTIRDPIVRVRVNTESTQTQPSSQPSAHNPNYLDVIEMELKKPKYELFMPNVIIEAIMKKRRGLFTKKLYDDYIGVFDNTLESVVESYTKGYNIDAASEADLKLVLEENGMDPADALKGFGEDGMKNHQAAVEQSVQIADEDAEDEFAEDIEEEEEKETPDPENRAIKVEHEPVEKFPDELENHLDPTLLPYRKLQLRRGVPPFYNTFTNGFDRTPRNLTAGWFKGRLHIVNKVNKRPLTELGQELRQQFISEDVIVRLYVYRAYYLVPAQHGTNTTTFLTLECENKDPQRYPGKNSKPKPWPSVEKTLSPAFRHTFQDIKLKLPGISTLTLSVWDRAEGMFEKDELIGYTKIDIEDRHYCPDFNENWNRTQLSKKQKSAVVKQWVCVAPTEDRILWSDTTRGAQGKVECFLQILKPEDAKRYEPINIKGPGPLDFELHTILYECKDLGYPPGQSEEDANTFGCLCCKNPVINPKCAIQCMWKYPEDEGPKPMGETDIVYNHAVNDKKAAFNWRFKFPVTLPCKFHFLQMTIEDASSIILMGGKNIAENTFNMKAFFDRAYKNFKAPFPGTMIWDGKKTGTWLELKHPKSGDETKAKVMLSMYMIAKDAIGSNVTLEGENGWSSGVMPLGKPDRPPTSFNKWNPIGWYHYLVWKYKYKVYCCCVSCLLLIILIIVLYILKSK